MGEEEYCDGVGYQVVQGHDVGGGVAGRPVHSLLCHPLEVSGSIYHFCFLETRKHSRYYIGCSPARGCKHSPDP